MILVDSSVWIDYFRGLASRQTSRLDNLLGSRTIVIGDIILTEVLQGFTTDRDLETARQVLSTLAVIAIATPDLAVPAARHFRTLRAHGVTIRKTIDTVIATRCIADSLPLLYSGRDFDPFVRHLGLTSAL